MAGVALMAADDAVFCLNGSFVHRLWTASDPRLSVRRASSNVRFSGKTDNRLRSKVSSRPGATQRLIDNLE